MLDLDPLSLNTNFSVAWILLFAGEYERAIDQARKTLDLYPDALHAHYVLGWSHAAGTVDHVIRPAVAARERFV